MIGGWVETGHVPNDHDLLDRLLTDICYQNAANWFLEGEAV
jgi:glucuronate isomerase